MLLALQPTADSRRVSEPTGPVRMSALHLNDDERCELTNHLKYGSSNALSGTCLLRRWTASLKGRAGR